MHFETSQGERLFMANSATTNFYKAFHWKKWHANCVRALLYQLSIKLKVILIALSIFSFSHYAVGATHKCVVPDKDYLSGGACIPFSKVQLWLQRSSIHDNSGGLKEDVVLNFKQGIYRLNSPLLINSLVMGAGKHRLTLAGSGATIFSGSKPLKHRPLSTDELKSLKLPYGVQVAQLKDSGINVVPEFEQQIFGRSAMPDIEVFYKGKRLPLARLPATGFAKISFVKNIDGHDYFTLSGLDVSLLNSESDLRVGGFFKHDWAPETIAVKKIDPSGSVVLSGKPPVYGIAVGGRVWFENALSAIKQPGNWSLDRANGLVYVYLPEGGGDESLEVSYANNGIELTDVSNVVVKDLIFESFRGVGIKVDKSSNIIISKVAVRNVGTTGISVHGKNVTVDNVVVTDTGGVGISMSGGDRRTLQRGNLIVKHATIERSGRLIKAYAPAINLYGVGNVVENSILRDGPHAAIIFHGNNHMIRWNHIDDFVQDTDDAGAIYTGQDWTERGTIIEGNIIRNTGSKNNKFRAHAIYLDDQASGITVKNNLIVSARRGVFIGGGRDNLITENIFSACDEAVFIDGRGAISVLRDGPLANKKFLVKLTEFKVTRPPFSSQYPELASLANDEPGLPKNNQIKRNVFIDSLPLSVLRPAQLSVLESESIIYSDTMADQFKNTKIGELPALLARFISGGRKPSVDEMWSNIK